MKYLLLILQLYLKVIVPTLELNLDQTQPNGKPTSVHIAQQTPSGRTPIINIYLTKCSTLCGHGSQKRKTSFHLILKIIFLRAGFEPEVGS